MLSGQVTRRVYSAEQLHRLRNAYSLPKLEEAIEERDGEDAEVVKEHVLRGSKSFTARSFRSRTSARSLRVPSATSNDENAPLSTHVPDHRLQTETLHPPGAVLDEIAGNSQTLRPVLLKFGPSPTPSMKRRKAEAIVKAHGSPQHLRVTAGGRIVPSEQSPLCHPRYGYSAVKLNGGLIKFAPNYHAGKAQWTRATENGFVAQDVHGNLCQIVNGMVLPLNQVDGALRLYIPAPNLKVTQRGSNQGPIGLYPDPDDGPQLNSSELECAPPLEPSIPSQISALELEYTKLENDLKDVDKTEVIHGRTMSKGGKDALVTRRRELVINMDKVRKALKALKNQPPPDAPTSPRGRAHGHTTSSPIPRHLPFSSHQSVSDSMRMQSRQQMYGLYAGGPLPTYNTHFAFPQMPPLGDLYPGQPWGYGNPGVFVPSPCDGSLGAPLPPLPDQEYASAFQQIPISGATHGEGNVPQNDGGGSQTEPHIRSPCRSHAVPIKAPDNNSASQKSTLNPMSPAYKPALGAKPVNDSSAGGSIDVSERRLCGPLVAPLEGGSREGTHDASRDGLSPTKKNLHLQSSSISSFETADFFPRNTFEYSTRLRSPTYRQGSITEKENKDPESSVSMHGTRPTTPHQGSFGDDWGSSKDEGIVKNRSPLLEPSQPPAPPPGTPVHPNETALKSTASMEINQALWCRKSKAIEQDAVPNRADHNISPKSKRDCFSVERDTNNTQLITDPSIHNVSLNQDEKTHAKTIANVIDFTRKPREWIEGYQAGLRRQPVAGDRYGDFLDGYCEGLLKSKPIVPGPSPHSHATGSPTRLTIRRPTPISVPRSSMRHREDQTSNATRDFAKVDPSNTAVLKQAIISPQNEDAILTPSNEGQHVTEYPFNLGAWTRDNSSSRVDDVGTNAARVFSDTTFAPTSMPLLSMRRVTSDGGKCSSRQGEADHPSSMSDGNDRAQHLSAAQASERIKDQVAPSASHKIEGSTAQSASVSNHTTSRVDNVTGIDSTMNRPWSGHRVFSPHLDIKPTSSISRAASVATGFFAHTQFDGAPHSNRITSAASTTVVPTNAHGHFHERPSNRVMSSPSSPPVALPTSPSKRTFANESPRRKLGVQGKTSSPAKSTFDNLAGKVGIKVSPNVKVNTDDGTNTGIEGASPSGKRRWRDVWRGGVRKDDNH